MIQLVMSLTLREKVLASLVLIGGFISSLLEVISLGSVIPLITILIEPDKFKAFLSGYVSNRLIEQVTIQIVVIMFCASVILATIAKSAIFWFNARVSQLIGKNLNGQLIKRYFSCRPEVISKLTPSEVNANFTTRSETITINVIQMFFNILISIFSSLFIMTFIVLFDPFAFTVAIIPIVIFYALLQLFLKKKLKIIGETIYDALGSIMLQLDNLNRSINELHLYNKVDNAITPLVERDNLLKKNRALLQVISNVPRFVMEGLALVSLSVACLILLKFNYTQTEVLTTISVITFAVLRLVPAAHQIYSSWGIFQTGFVAVVKTFDFIEELEALTLNETNCGPKKNIKIYDHKIAGQFESVRYENLSFKYPGSDEFIFRNIELRIDRGDVLLIKGASGSGKTTLMNVLCGIYKLTEGSIKLNEKVLTDEYALRSIFAFAPQEPFISDSNLDENILFGSNHFISSKKLGEIKEELQIFDLEGNAGEYVSLSKKLSGGQKQRVSLARCIVKQKEIALIDEGFSALDRKSKEKLFNFLKSQQETIVMISHDPSDEFFASKIIDMEQIVCADK